MKRFNLILIALLLLVSMVLISPALAQDDPPDIPPDATPTIEVAAPQPDTDDSGVDTQNWVDDLLDWASENNLVLIIPGVIALIYAISQIRTPQTADEYERNKAAIRDREEEAARTQTKLDDYMTKIEALLNELRPRGIPAPDYSPPVISPPISLDPQPFPIVDIFGLADDARQITWNKDGHPQVLLQQPHGWELTVNEADTDGNFARPNSVNVETRYGIRHNIAHNAQRYHYQRLDPVAVGIGRYRIGIEYHANVPGSGGHPLHNFVQMFCYANGNPLAPAIPNSEMINHHSLQDTETSIIEWEYASDKAEAITVEFVLAIHYANAEGSSVIEIKRFGGLKKN